MKEFKKSNGERDCADCISRGKMTHVCFCPHHDCMPISATATQKPGLCQSLQGVVVTISKLMTEPRIRALYPPIAPD